MNTCKSCKYWGVNREAILNGIENTSRSNEAHCENENILKSMRVWENNLPDWITPSIRSDFVTNYMFGCTFWEEYIGWKKLWE